MEIVPFSLSGGVGGEGQVPTKFEVSSLLVPPVRVLSEDLTTLVTHGTVIEKQITAQSMASWLEGARGTFDTAQQADGRTNQSTLFFH